MTLVVTDPYWGNNLYYADIVYEDRTELFKEHPFLLDPQGNKMKIYQPRHPIGFDLTSRKYK